MMKMFLFNILILSYGCGQPVSSTPSTCPRDLTIRDLELSSLKDEYTSCIQERNDALTANRNLSELK